jgi:hypothetical protein
MRQLLLLMTLALTLPVFAQKKEAAQPAATASPKIVTGTILLNSKTMPDSKALFAALKNDWKIKVDSPSVADKTIVFSVPGATVMIAYLDYALPPAEVKAASRISWLWQKAAEEAGKHQAQVVISVIGGQNRALTLYQVFTRVAAAVLDKNDASGIYMNSQYLLLNKDFYLFAARNMHQNQTIPVYLWVYFGMTDQNGFNSGYTYGLQEFGLPEMEIVNSKRTLQEVHSVLYDAAIQVVRNNIRLFDGQVLTTEEDVKITARNAKSQFQDGVTAVRFEY